MSTTIDQKVVEMRFDNQHFEKNVGTTLSTLDKLKQKLNLTGSSKGLEELGNAAKKVDMNGVGRGVDTVSAKFSALQVMGVTALANITNSAVNAGKRMISALTIDPVKTGLQEYETQINSVQTILANTKSKGSTIDDVNKALEELNKYADLTIYNFTEMTRNIGTFTAAGVDLDNSVSAIKGIANLAAVSGSTSQQASTAMYQLSQALATGTVKLQDWNSVVNAGMGGEVFQNALVRTAAAMDGAAGNVEAWRKENVDAYGSFRDSLTQGAWLTTDVLTQTLNQFTMYAEEGTEEWEKYKKSLMETGYTEKQAEEILDMAKTATEAATKVKTFTQLWDVLKEAAQSGWSQTWKIIIGDFEEAKALFSPLAEFLTGVIGKMSDARNKLLEGALGRTWMDSFNKIKNVLDPIKKSADAVKEVTKSVSDYTKVVDDIISGDWGTGQERWDKLTKAGYDWAHAQNMVNEKLGDSTRHTTKYKEAQDAAAKSQEKVNKTVKDSSAVTATQITWMARTGEEQLKALGYTEEQIAAVKELKEVSEKTGIPLQEFIENIDEIDGRYILIQSFKNAASGLVGVFKAVAEAWGNVFDALKPEQLFDVIAGFHKFSLNLRLTDAETGELTETGKKLVRTFEGIFSIVSIVSDIIGGGLKLAFNAIKAVLSHFDLDILDVTAAIGDALVKFRKATDVSEVFAKAIEFLAPIVKVVADKIKELVDAFLQLPKVQQAIDKIKDIIDYLKNLDFSEIGTNIAEGLANGLDGGIHGVIQAMLDLGKKLLSAIKDVLGIHSPSTEFFEIGKNIIDGLLNGLKDGANTVVEFVTGIANKLIDFVSNIDFGTLLAVGISSMTLLIIKKVSDFFGALTNVLDGVGDVLEESADAIKTFGKVLKGFSMNLKAKALKNIAIAVAILAGSVLALSFIPADKLATAVAAVAALAGVLLILSTVAEKMSDASVKLGKEGLNIDGLKSGLLGMAAALLILAVIVKIMGSMSLEDAIKGFVGLGLLIGAMSLTFYALGKVVKGDVAKNIDKVGGMMIKLSIALGLMVIVCKMVRMLTPEDMLQAGVFATAFLGFTVILTKVAKTSGNNVSKVGGLVLKIAIAMALMVGVCKLAATLSAEEMVKGTLFAGALLLFVKELVRITKVGKSSKIAKLGGLLLSISASMLLMVGIAKLAGLLSAEDIIKGGAFMLAFVGFVKLLVKATTIGDNTKIAKLTGTLLSVSIAIGVLAAISIMFSLVKLGALAKGVTAVSILGLIVRGMILATKDATDCKGTLIGMAIAIGVMAASVAALSFIDPKKLLGAGTALGIVMGMFGAMAKGASNIQSSLKSLITMTVMVGLLAGMLYILSGMPIENTIGAATSLSLLLLSISTSMKLLSGPNLVSTKTLVTVGILTLVVGGLAGILYLLKDLPVENTLTNATSLSVLLLSLSSCCLILGGVGVIGSTAFVGIGVLLGLIVSVGTLIVAIGALVDKFPKLERFLDKGVPILEKIGYALGSFFGNIIGGFSAGITSGLPEIGENLSKFMTNLGGFATGAKKFTDDSVTGVKNLAKMMLALTGAGVVDAIAKFIPGYEGLDGIGPKLNSFAEAVVGFSNTIIQNGGIDEDAVNAAANAGIMMAKLTESLPKAGGLWQEVAGEKDLDQFGLSCLAFGRLIARFSKSVSGENAVDLKAAKAAADAGTVMSELQNSLPKKGGLWQQVAGEQDLALFGASCVAFGRLITKFSKTVSGENAIDSGAVEAATDAGTLMSTLQNTLPKKGGLWQQVAGEQDLATFGMSCLAFGRLMARFSREVSGENAIDPAAMESTAKAGSLLAKLQTALPKTGGWIQTIAGEQDMVAFGATCVAFGKAMKTFASEIGDGINDDAVKSVSNAGTMMAKLQKAIPEDKWLDGKVSISEFGAKISTFGTHLVNYSNKVSEVDNGVVSSSITSAERLVALAKSLVDLDTSGIEKFKVSSIGTSMSTYADKVADIDASLVSSSITSATRLKVFINGLGSMDNSGIDKFKPAPIGSSMKAYASAVSGINSGTVSSSISAATRLKNFINSLGSLDTSGVDSFKSAVNSLAKTNIDGVVKAFSGASGKFTSVGTDIVNALTKGMTSGSSAVNKSTIALINLMLKTITGSKPQFATAGKTVMDGFLSGITSQKTKVGTTLSATLKSSINTARGYYDNFYSAGSYLVSGFANGISANDYKAKAKAKAMAEAAIKAAREALQINSPSKVFRAIGKGVPEGFAQGIGMLGGLVTRSTTKMADSAISSTKGALARIADSFNTDVDSQPTIRPVVDLSDVSAGARAINGMFGVQPSVGVLAKVNALSSSMAGYSQNGNGDLISAINKLGKSLANSSGGNTYIVDGVTYDDGSNVTNAVKDIIRYTRIEGRA